MTDFQQAIFNFLVNTELQKSQQIIFTYLNRYANNNDLPAMVEKIKQDLQGMQWPEQAGVVIQTMLSQVAQDCPNNQFLGWVALSQALYQHYLACSAADFSFGKIAYQDIFLMIGVYNDFEMILNNALKSNILPEAEQTLAEALKSTLDQQLLALTPHVNKLSTIESDQTVIMLTQQIGDKRGLLPLFELFKRTIPECYKINTLAPALKKVFQLRKLIFEFLVTEEIFVRKCQEIRNNDLKQLIIWYLNGSGYEIPQGEEAMDIYWQYSETLDKYQKIINGLKLNYNELRKQCFDIHAVIIFFYKMFISADFYMDLEDYYKPIIQHYPNLTRLIARIQNDLCAKTCPETLTLLRQSQDALAEPFQRVPRYGLIAAGLVPLLTDDLQDLLFPADKLADCKKKAAILKDYFEKQAKQINAQIPGEKDTLTLIAPYCLVKLKESYLEILKQISNEANQLAVRFPQQQQTLTYQAATPYRTCLHVLAWASKMRNDIEYGKIKIDEHSDLSEKFTEYLAGQTLTNNEDTKKLIEKLKENLKNAGNYKDNPLFYRAYRDANALKVVENRSLVLKF